ncbi:MAG: hypothetical protein JO213_04535 [Alphaproteobacteria bacterium]|nr:hypothetical protein [Alphaproteobacteria bacterium]
MYPPDEWAWNIYADNIKIVFGDGTVWQGAQDLYNHITSWRTEDAVDNYIDYSVDTDHGFQSITGDTVVPADILTAKDDFNAQRAAENNAKNAAAQNDYGTSGNDTLTGGIGNDTFYASAGNNVIDGGSGTNTVDYASAPEGVNVDLTAGTAANGYGGTDTISNVQNVVGSGFDDVITGSPFGGTLDGGAGDDTLIAGDGNTRLIGGSGNNTLKGGSGTVTADYSGAPSGVTVDLGTGIAANGYGGTDTLTAIQSVIGNYGDSANNCPCPASCCGRDLGPRLRGRNILLVCVSNRCRKASSPSGRPMHSARRSRSNASGSSPCAIRAVKSG